MTEVKKTLGNGNSTCFNCRYSYAFYIIEDSGDVTLIEEVECRRNAPTPCKNEDDATFTYWPVMEPDDWCGEWQPILNGGANATP